MKLTILGSGTVVPNGERNSSGYFVETAKARILLDCGAGTVHALARYGRDWEAITHIFLSHFHVDHIGELASLFFAFRHALTRERSDKLLLIAPPGINRVLHHLKAAFGETVFTPKFPFEVLEVEPGASLSIGDGQLSVCKTPHTEESLALRLDADGKAIGYTGDTDYSDELASFFSRASLLVSECSFREKKAGVKHLSIADVGRLAARSQVERVVVTHFYFAVREEEVKRELEKDYAGEVVIGRDGLSLEI